MIYRKIIKTFAKYVVLLVLGISIAIMSVFVPINGIVLPIPIISDGGFDVVSVSRGYEGIAEVGRGLPIAWHTQLVTRDLARPLPDCLDFLDCDLPQLVSFFLDVVFWTAAMYGFVYLMRRLVKQKRETN